MGRRLLERLRTTLGVSAWTFVGVSAGGALGLTYAAMFGSSLSGLVLASCRASIPANSEDGTIYNPALPRHPALLSALRRVNADRLNSRDERRLIWPLLAERVEVVSEMLDRGVSINADRRRAFLRQRADLFPSMSSIAVPTLMLHGRHDPSVPLREAIAIAAALPSGSLQVLEDCGHFPFAEEPVLCKGALRAFLANL